jgi:hypothetical protein
MSVEELQRLLGDTTAKLFFSPRANSGWSQPEGQLRPVAILAILGVPDKRAAGLASAQVPGRQSVAAAGVDETERTSARKTMRRPLLPNPARDVDAL